MTKKEAARNYGQTLSLAAAKRYLDAGPGDCYAYGLIINKQGSV
jgi:hypothetical protein